MSASFFDRFPKDDWRPVSQRVGVGIAIGSCGILRGACCCVYGASLDPGSDPDPDSDFDFDFDWDKDGKARNRSCFPGFNLIVSAAACPSRIPLRFAAGTEKISLKGTRTMGSGRSNEELTYAAKKPRERRRRDAIQKKRLLALGVPQARVDKMTTQAIRQMLGHPEKTRRQWAPG